MNEQTTVSNRADIEAVEAVKRHHAAMASTLSRLVGDLVLQAATGGAATPDDRREQLVHWCRTELVPHALAEERAMYPAAHAIEAGRLLVDGMLTEHKVIVGLVDEVERADNTVAAATAARALSTVFELHLGKENELVLPLLSHADDVSVAELLAGMHELLGAEAEVHEEHGHRSSHGAAHH